MGKRIISLFFVLFLCLQVPAVVFAHPGRTDSNGGHTDHSTGEYHYHHGYPAHQHYDMDGNGTIDCPYLFDDQTDHTPSDKPTSSRNETNSFDEQLEEELEKLRKENENSNQPSTKPSEETTNSVKTSKSFWDYAMDVLVFLWDNLLDLVLVFFGGLFVLAIVADIVKRIRR